MNATASAYAAKLAASFQPIPSTLDIIRKEAGAKASETKGRDGHRRAWLKAKITMATRAREGLTGPAKGKVTKGIRALERELAALA